MNDKITSVNIKEFLKDHLERAEIILLEEGSKEKNDIMDVAKAKGYILKDSTDLAGFKTIFTFADKANINKARLPKELLLKALPGIIGKPVDIDHNRIYVVGHYIDYSYVVAKDMVIAYGVFYKSNFGEEWSKAKELFKAGKLGTSYEIWCPKNKRKMNPDGTYSLMSIEIAGGGLMFKEKPAFPDAQVLEIAKANILNHAEVMKEFNQDLVFASKQYDSTEILNSSDTTIGSPVSTALPAGAEVKDNTEVPGPQVTAGIKCSNCTKTFIDAGDSLARTGEVKCPECFAILDKTGKMVYPPQMINFSMSCPGCSARNWKLLTDSPEKASVKCQSCADNYDVEFKKGGLDPMLQKLAFVYIGSASCPQCSSQIPFSTVSRTDVKGVKCPKCDLSFSVDLHKIDKNRKISKFTKTNTRVLEDNLTVSSEKGGNNSMSTNPEQKPEVPVVEVPKVEAAEVTPVIETPAEVAPVVETPVVAQEEITEVEDAEAIEQEEVLEVAKTLKAEDRNKLSNDDFAVVKQVKDKKTGNTSTVRKYPIHDKAHVANALARLAQGPSRDGLKKLGVDPDAVITKVKAKGKALGMEEADMEACGTDTSMQAAQPRDKENVQQKTPKDANNFVAAKSNEAVQGFNPDQVQQMQNQMFAKADKFKMAHKMTMKAWKLMKKAMATASLDETCFKSIEKAMADVDVMMNMGITPMKGDSQTDRGTGEKPTEAVTTGDAPTPKVEGPAGSDTAVDLNQNAEAIKLAKDLAEAKPVVAPAAPVVNASVEETPGSDVTVKTVEKTAEELAADLVAAKPVEAPAAPVVNMERASVDVIKENESLKEKVSILETAAVKLIERKQVLGDFGKDLSDKDIVDDAKFEVAKLRMENAQLKAKLNSGSSKVAEIHETTMDSSKLKQLKSEIDLKAFPKQ